MTESDDADEREMPGIREHVVRLNRRIVRLEGEIVKLALLATRLDRLERARRSKDYLLWTPEKLAARAATTSEAEAARIGETARA